MDFELDKAVKLNVGDVFVQHCVHPSGHRDDFIHVILAIQGLQTDHREDVVYVLAYSSSNDSISYVSFRLSAGQHGYSAPWWTKL